MKVEEFINIKQGSYSVDEYLLKVNMLSMYAASSVSNPRYVVNRFYQVLSTL